MCFSDKSFCREFDSEAINVTQTNQTFDIFSTQNFLSQPYNSTSLAIYSTQMFVYILASVEWCTQTKWNK